MPVFTGCGGDVVLDEPFPFVLGGVSSSIFDCGVVLFGSGSTLFKVSGGVFPFCGLSCG